MTPDAQAATMSPGSGSTGGFASNESNGHGAANLANHDVNAAWQDPRLDLSTHIGVLTGGARGIGAATCVRLCRAGIKTLAVVDLGEGVDNFTAQTNERLGREALVPFRGDVTDSAFRTHVFAEMERRFGPVSICIPAAGITKDRLAVRINKETGETDLYPETEFRHVIDIDLTAPIYWAIETIASIAKSRMNRGLKRWTPSEPTQGVIVFIGSVSSTGNRGQISYATAKAGLEGAAATLNSEGAYHGIRSVVIHPGYTDTSMVRVLGDRFINETIVPHTQLGRLIHPAEIADAILFLIQNSAMSGALWCDAGWKPIP
jgi:NAD(P)-dependent dehydrogenase (short-subunit alcohol dehydrogenase family)